MRRCVDFNNASGIETDPIFINGGTGNAHLTMHILDFCSDIMENIMHISNAVTLSIFERRIARAIASLEEFGYGVVEDVMSPSEVRRGIQLFQRFKSSIDDHDWVHKHIDPHGIYKHHGAGCAPHAWHCRMNRWVLTTFARIFNTTVDNLVTSLDGSCHYPAGPVRVRQKSWTHTDQSALNKAFCVQSLMSLTDNEECTLVVYSGSHKQHHETLVRMGRADDKKNWIKISDEELELIKDTKRVLKVKAGTLVLWNSKTCGGRRDEMNSGF